MHTVVPIQPVQYRCVENCRVQRPGENKPSLTFQCMVVDVVEPDALVQAVITTHAVVEQLDDEWLVH